MSAVTRIEIERTCDAQRAWKRLYRTWRVTGYDLWRDDMLRLAYPAALERALVAMTRRTEQAKAKRDRFIEGIGIAKLAMIALGNDLNWPPIIPLSYADAINGLRELEAAAAPVESERQA
jgi:hypothetical protein